MGKHRANRYHPATVKTAASEFRYGRRVAVVAGAAVILTVAGTAVETPAGTLPSVTAEPALPAQYTNEAPVDIPVMRSRSTAVSILNTEVEHGRHHSGLPVGGGIPGHEPERDSDHRTTPTQRQAQSGPDSGERRDSVRRDRATPRTKDADTPRTTTPGPDAPADPPRATEGQPDSSAPESTPVPDPSVGPSEPVTEVTDSPANTGTERSSINEATVEG